MGISCDNVPTNIAFAKQIGVSGYPLLSDFYPHGKVAEAYGILRTGDPLPGISERAIFVVDKSGKIAWKKVNELGKQPDNAEILEVLRKL